jgi:hypothetical protein
MSALSYHREEVLRHRGHTMIRGKLIDGETMGDGNARPWTDVRHAQTRLL